jgi:hypothetical protein
MTRTFRRLAALLAAGTLVFAQLAVSAVACPMESSARAAPAVHGAVPDATAEACPEAMNPNLCEQHCDYGASSVGSSATAVHAPDLAPLPWSTPLVASNIPASQRVASLIARTTAPPAPPPQPTPLRI